MIWIRAETPDEVRRIEVRDAKELANAIREFRGWWIRIDMDERMNMIEVGQLMSWLTMMPKSMDSQRVVDSLVVVALRELGAEQKLITQLKDYFELT